MKHLLYLGLLLLMLTFTNSHAQTATNIDAIPFAYELPAEANHCWDSIYDKWQKTEFLSCITQFGLKLSCATCTSIFFDAVISIDSTGKITECYVYKRKICEKQKYEALEKCIFDYFRKIQYPPVLHNLQFRSKFGNGLRC